MTSPIHLVRERTGDPVLDTAVSRAILRRVAAGELPETIRLTVPGRIVAFGRQDTVRPGYPQAVAASRSMGFTPVERLAGGRAAVFHEGTVAFAWARPAEEPAAGIHPRFVELATVMRDSFRSLGIDARVGEVPGEYCPGAYSVNTGGRRKVMGVGQRLTRTAAHVGGVIVTSGAELVNAAIQPVYEALDYPWDPAATGALDQEAAVGSGDVVDAIVTTLSARYDVVPDRLDDTTVALARRLAADHVPAGR